MKNRIEGIVLKIEKTYFISAHHDEIDYVLAVLVYYYRKQKPDIVRFEKDGLTFWGKKDLPKDAVPGNMFPVEPISDLNHRYVDIRSMSFGLFPFFYYRKHIWNETLPETDYGIMFSPSMLKITQLEKAQTTLDAGNVIRIDSAKSFIFNRQEIPGLNFVCPEHTRSLLIEANDKSDAFQQKIESVLEKVKRIYPGIIEKQKGQKLQPFLSISKGGKEYSFQESMMYWYATRNEDKWLCKSFDNENTFFENLRNEKARWGL